MSQELIEQEPVDSVRRSLLIAGALGVLGLAAGCAAAGPPHESTPPVATDPQVQMVEQYETETGVEKQLMFFTGFPENNLDARTMAAQTATMLKTWNRSGVKPLVIMEPTFKGGSVNMDLHAFGRGKYNKPLNEYFGMLRSLGVTNEELGTLVPFSEPNTPGWAGSVTDPRLFIHNTSYVARMYREYFPGAPVSVLLDSQTFLPSPDPGWNNGTMNPQPLKDYLHFRPGLIDSFGLQGFTWDNKDDPSTFLSAKAAIEGARALGVNHVWFNTGTYSVVNNPNGEGIILAGNARRSEVLHAILRQAVNAQSAGINVDFINIFGQDKLDRSKSGTGTADYQYVGHDELHVLKRFVDEAQNHNIPVAIFDAT